MTTEPRLQAIVDDHYRAAAVAIGRGVSVSEVEQQLVRSGLDPDHARAVLGVAGRVQVHTLRRSGRKNAKGGGQAAVVAGSGARSRGPR